MQEPVPQRRGAGSDRRRDREGQQASSPGSKQIKQFFLIEQQPDAEDEELTPTMKLKRSLINKKYADQIDAMYTASKEMYEPFHKLKFAFSASYFDQMRVFAPKVAKEKNAKKVCTLYQDDDFGTEVMNGAEAGLKTIGMSLAEKTTYKTGATDFSSQVARLKAAECDMVILGTVLRETIGTIATARRTGFNPTFLGSSAAYFDLVHKLGGKAMDGLYATMTVQNPYLDSASQPLRFWATKYQTKFNEEPAVFSVYGYTAIDNFITAANAAGPNLTTDAFIKALETVKFPADIFGSPETKFGPNKRQGSDQARLSQIVDGKWKVLQ
jgi:branched-chain amino acid transport system substrate-binding protein